MRKIAPPFFTSLIFPEKSSFFWQDVLTRKYRYGTLEDGYFCVFSGGIDRKNAMECRKKKLKCKKQKAEPGKANVCSHAGDLLKIDTDREADYQYPSDRLITGWKNWINMNTTSSWRK